MPEAALELLHPVVREWFTARYGAPSPPQRQGWPAIAAGENALLLAPTGSGKTLAAFLLCLDRLWRQGLDGALPAGVQVIYVSPLKALNNDIQRNLAEPLAGVAAHARAQGLAWPVLRTAVRSGDTPQAERAAMLARPPHVLITTPESLYLLLTSRSGRQALQSVQTLILDEIHAVCATKRGTHLALTVERLEHLAGRPLQRIGLSATQRPLEEIARYLGGQDDGGTPRPVTILDAGARKSMDLRVEVPVPDLGNLPGDSIWPNLYPVLVDQIRQHRSTLVFVNNRGSAERVARHINQLAGADIARTHHGSMARDVRRQVEEDLKAERLPALVATSSLELGIDIGAVDLVIQIESPRSVARGLQRVGRAGHLLGATSKGRILPKMRSDLLEAACIARLMRRGEIESTRIPQNCLDVLAQQIVAMAAVGRWTVDEILALARRTYSYRALTLNALESVLDLLAGRYPAEDFGELRPRITWDKVSGELWGRENARVLALASGGTIPDRGYFAVHLGEGGPKLGELDEEMVFESRPGDVIVLGSGTWRIESIGRDRVVVAEAYGAPHARLTFWKGEGLGRPYEMGRHLGEFVRTVGDRLDDPGLTPWLQAECVLSEWSAANLIQYLADQRQATGELPSDRCLVLEHFRDELGDLRLVLHSPFGGQVHAAWTMALRRHLYQTHGIAAEMFWSDEGIMIHLPSVDTAPPVHLATAVSAATAPELVTLELANSPLFAALFRHNATRSLVLPRAMPGRRRPLWLQRLRAADLLEVARRHPSFPVLIETYREALQDVLDLRALEEVLAGVAAGDIAVHVCETAVPSPFASQLMFNFTAAYMYEYDAPRAERRSQLLSINHELLREALGGDVLRSLLEPRAIQEAEAYLQRTAPERQARTADELADLLFALGDLDRAEVAARCSGDAPALLAELAAGARAVRLRLPTGAERWVSSDDVALYRDAFALRPDDIRPTPGAPPLPAAFTARHYQVSEAAGAILSRHARTHAPFQMPDLAARYGWPPDYAAALLAVLQAEGQVVSGEYTPGRSGREWCDAGVLQQMHRRTLALLRREIEPCDPPDFTAFLQRWQGVTTPARGLPALRRALSQLQGLFLPLEAWEQEILPRRVIGYGPSLLDELLTTGEFIWVARGSAAPGRARLAFIRPEDPGLLPSAPAEPLSAEARAVSAALAQRGASFLGGLAVAVGLTPAQALGGIWELVWAGLVANDTFAPLRQALSAGHARAGAARRGAPPPLIGGVGRWSLLAPAAPPPRAAALPGTAPEAPSPPEAAERWARLWLERYGVVARECWAAEEPPVPWGEVLRVLQQLEAVGEVRRGYFVRGLAGAQFALPTAVERLRALRSAHHEGAEKPPLLLCACDPANPYGALFPLPAEGVRLVRVPTVHLVFGAGVPVLLADGFGKRLVPLTALAGDDLLQALAPLQVLPSGRRGRRRVEVTEYDGRPVQTTPAAAALEALGFERQPQKLVYWAPAR